jgi:sulfatase modifying factor 1
MGSDAVSAAGRATYPEEGPTRLVTVAGFRLERHPVTNAQFARFVAETGYVTIAEQRPDPASLPGVDAALLVPGSLVFTATSGPVPLDDWSRWWRFLPGASWRHPHGPGSSLEGIENHPVVQVCFDDALAYARWCGRRLPTEAEFEYAARAGRPATVYAWGDKERPYGQLMANTWQGEFPYANVGAAGWRGTSPVGTFPADPWGFVDLIGNVWEWTSTYYATGPLREEADRQAAWIDSPTEPAASDGLGRGAPTCCAPTSERDRLRGLSTMPGESRPRRVVKGGSHLCAPSYCYRYRPPARQPQSEDSATTHLGFRCAL